MYSEPLFQEFLDNRASMAHQGKRINTKRAVEMLRKKLEIFNNEGYSCNLILENSIEAGWRSVFRPKGVEPRQKPLKAPREIMKQVKGINNKIPPAHANRAKQRAAVEAMRQVLEESK